ncbi:hypothetical protein ACFE04_018227 [Oxalis oulophora]
MKDLSVEVGVGLTVTGAFRNTLNMEPALLHTSNNNFTLVYMLLMDPQANLSAWTPRLFSLEFVCVNDGSNDANLIKIIHVLQIGLTQPSSFCSFGRFISRLHQPVNDATIIQIKDVAARLEECFFKKSFIEDYRNLETLKSRWRALVGLNGELIRSLLLSARSSGVQTGGLPNQGGPASMQNGFDIGSSSNLFNVDSELLHARDFIREHICAKILEQKTEPVSNVDKMKTKAYAKLLEGALFKMALTDNYMNLGTFTSRFEVLMRRGLIRSNVFQKQQPANLLRKRTTALPGRDIL